MHHLNTRDITTERRSSPHGKYQLVRQHLSVALGAKPDGGPWDGGHPFDVELTRLPPGAKNFPLHQHSAQWEFYLIAEGRGEVTDGTTTRPLEPGDVLLFPPEHPHQFINTGTTDLVYHVIATNQQADVGFYPQTGTWGIKPQKKHFTLTEVPYYQPED